MENLIEQTNQFFNYFFGKGDTVEFENFTLPHFIPILIMLLTIAIIGIFKDKIRNLKCEKNIRYVIAFVMIISEMAYYWRIVGIPSLGPSPANDLPIAVCGWVLIFGSYMIVGKSQKLFDICYFWLLAGTIFALITPTVITYTGPTRFRYYQFWAAHLTGYIAVFYMIFVHKMRPTVRSAVRSYLALGVLAVIAYIANQLIGPGANYLFMARPESTPSVLDILPPNFTLRILIMIAVITFLFFVAYLPWLIKDKKALKQKIIENGLLSSF